MLKIWIGSLLYFAVAYFYSARYHYAIFIVIAPLLFVYGYVHLSDFKSSMVSLPSTVFLFLAVGCGYLLKTRKNIFPVAALFGLMLLYSLSLEKYWSNKINYGYFSQRVNGDSPMPFTLYKSDYKTMTLDSFSRITLLDFWNSHCGPCYREFPFIDSVYKKGLKNHIAFYSVNVPMGKEKLGDNFTRLDKYQYSFPLLFATTPNLIDSFSVLSFPTTLVIFNGRVVFRGTFQESYTYALELN